MKTIIRVVAFIAFTAILSGSASAQCKRHFYNNSPVYFNMVMVGVVGFGGLCNGGPYCSIPPGYTVTLVYTLAASAYIRIWSSFYSGTFPIIGCYIMHKGSTGAIALNDPADGDVKTCGGPRWPCTSYGFKP